MLDFCASLFGLAYCPPAELRAALADLVGSEAKNGGVRPDRRLLYVDLESA